MKNRFSDILQGTGVLACIIVICALATLISGCSTAVGPTSTQTLAGQVTTNSSLNSGTFIDNPDGNGTGTTNIQTSGTITIVKQTAAGTEAKGSGVPPTTLTLARPDGSQLSLSSPNDTKGVVRADATTGVVTDVTFDTSASPVLNAFVNIEAQVTAAKLGLTQAQADVLKTISNDQRDTILGIAKQVSPEFLQAIKALLGG